MFLLIDGYSDPWVAVYGCIILSAKLAEIQHRIRQQVVTELYMYVIRFSPFRLFTYSYSISPLSYWSVHYVSLPFMYTQTYNLPAELRYPALKFSTISPRPALSLRDDTNIEY